MAAHVLYASGRQAGRCESVQQPDWNAGAYQQGWEGPSETVLHHRLENTCLRM